MPRIPDKHLDCVATLFVISEFGAASPVGTSFLLECREEMFSAPTIYLVTCVHCKIASEVVFSTGEKIILNKANWKIDPSGNDVMAMDVTNELPPNIKKHQFPGLEDHIPSFARRYRISDVGDEIYMLGLHTAEAWAETAAPRARFGNISAWADDNAPIRQGNDKMKASHIGDMRSRPGFSGSPVFTYRESLDSNDSPRPILFGIHTDQFPDQIKIRTRKREINATALSSMTVIVPAWALSFVLDDEGFKKARQKQVCYRYGGDEA